MHVRTRRPRGALALGVALLSLIGGGLVAAPAADAAAGYRQIDLVSDIPGRAMVTDPNLRNPWGVAFGPTTPLWTANEGTATSTLYTGAPPASPATVVPLVVRTPRSPAGLVFNPTDSFRLPDGTPARFVFSTLGGRIAGWAPGDPLPTVATTLRSVRGGVLTGLAIDVTPASDPRLYAADAAGGVVRVYDGRLRQVGTLRDPRLPAGLVPYGVAVQGEDVWVSYALPPGAAGAVEGAVSVFRGRTRTAHRVVTGGALRAPWGMVLAPDGWGHLGGALLVGNVEGGRINAFSPRTGRFLGPVRRGDGRPVTLDGLWGMQFGNGVIGRPDDLVVAAGIRGYRHGLVSLIRPVG